MVSVGLPDFSPFLDFKAPKVEKEAVQQEFIYSEVLSDDDEDEIEEMVTLVQLRE